MSKKIEKKVELSGKYIGIIIKGKKLISKVLTKKQAEEDDIDLLLTTYGEDVLIPRGRFLFEGDAGNLYEVNDGVLDDGVLDEYSGYYEYSYSIDNNKLVLSLKVIPKSNIEYDEDKNKVLKKLSSKLDALGISINSFLLKNKFKNNRFVIAPGIFKYNIYYYSLEYEYDTSIDNDEINNYVKNLIDKLNKTKNK